MASAIFSCQIPDKGLDKIPGFVHLKDMKKNENNPRCDTLLVFPPLWTPVTPYLALPVLVAYLRKHGLSTEQYDASLDFFTRYLLTKDTLLNLLERMDRRARAGDYAGASRTDRDRVRDIQKNRGLWEEKISEVDHLLSSLRDPASFYDPEICIRTQRDLYDLLQLASLAYYPVSFTFNTFAHPGLTDFPHMIRFCDDPQGNPFLAFYTTHVLRVLDEKRPALVGISISTSHQMAGALTLARLLKKMQPSLHVTLGGRHVLRLQESFKKESSFFPAFCHSLVIDSGERPLMHLVHQIQTAGALENVPNLAYFEHDRLVFTNEKDHEPISRLPTPDFSDLPLDRYLAPTPIIPVRLSEGCYWGKCTFCSRYDNRRFRTIAPEEGANQMAELHQAYGVSCFTVNDDCLTPTYLETLSRAILGKGLQFQISLWCKPMGTFATERLNLLGKAGVRLIRWGIETGHPRILKLMNKGTNLKDTLRVLKDAAGAGIWNHGTIILGFPTETLEEARETIRFLDRNQDSIHSSIFFRFILLNHSYIIKHPGEFAINSIREGKNPFSFERHFSVSEGMKPETLSSFLKEAQKKRTEDLYGHPFWFYLRIREYLLLYTARYGVEKVRGWKVRPDDLSLYTRGEEVRYFFQKPEEIPAGVLSKIRDLIASGGEVGLSWIDDNLKRAFLIGYAMEQDQVVGVMVHKRPLEKYVRQIQEKTGLDLQDYLERGYSSIRPGYRNSKVGDRLLKGLVDRSPDKKIYVTIRADNTPAIRLTRRNHMHLAATYYNEDTGHEVAVFVNHPLQDPPPAKEPSLEIR